MSTGSGSASVRLLDDASPCPAEVEEAASAGRLLLSTSLLSATLTLDLLLAASPCPAEVEKAASAGRLLSAASPCSALRFSPA